jgi:hypothetical protein
MKGFVFVSRHRKTPSKSSMAAQAEDCILITEIEFG